MGVEVESSDDRDHWKKEKTSRGHVIRGQDKNEEEEEEAWSSREEDERDREHVVNKVKVEVKEKPSPPPQIPMFEKFIPDISRFMGIPKKFMNFGSGMTDRYLSANAQIAKKQQDVNDDVAAGGFGGAAGGFDPAGGFLGAAGGFGGAAGKYNAFNADMIKHYMGYGNLAGKRK